VSTPLARYGSAGGVDTITLSSPSNRNALSIALMEQLLEHVARSEQGDGRALVLDHHGPVFCAGIDLHERRALGDAVSTHSTLLADVLRALWAYPKPLVCRVRGPVRGGGMGLIACADIVVADPTADFAYSEVRVGVAPALVAAVALVKVPLGRLLPFLITGEVFDARAALDIGLVTRLDDRASVALELAAVLRGAPNAVRTVKRMAREVAGADTGPVLDRMERLSASLFGSGEAREGMAAFAERRAPSWVLPLTV
jgi:enoyl-CoA hydratase/carnithine racemase